MKKLFTLSLAILSFITIYGQTSGGPDAYGYTWKNSNDPTSPPAYSWFDISVIGTPVVGLGDDNFVGPFNITGGFQFYWYSVNQFWIGSNGYISFQPGNVSSAFPAGMGLSAGVNDWIAVMTSDLNFATTVMTNPGKCYYYDNVDTTCVSWVDVPFWISPLTDPNAYTGSNSFQVILRKSTKSITFNYQSTNRGLVAGVIDDVIGIENTSGAIGLTALLDSLPPSNHTIKITFPPVVTFMPNDAGINWNNREGNGGQFVNVLHPYDLTTNVKNYGVTNLPAFTIDNSVVNPLAVPVTSGTLNIPSLPKDSDTTVMFTNKFTPITTGIHTYRTEVNLGIDVDPTNDYLDQKLIVVDTTTLMYFDYSDGVTSGSVNWTGGNGGCAVYIEPSVYPVKITASRFFITANTGGVGFSAVIYDDDGQNGGPGTVLDSVGVASSAVTTGNYNVVPTANTNLIIEEGGVYLYWKMGGANISLGTDNTAPISLQTYEVLIGTWAPYRSRTTTDFMMGLNAIFPITKANFSIDATLEPIISFTDLSSNNPTKWAWDFGDGSPIDTNQHPTHEYTSMDTFTVCLTATNFAGSTTICKQLIITKVLPIADFNMILSNEPTITFADNSLNNPTSWHWDFGDGDTANTKNTVHTYAANGTYNVCMIATNFVGSDTICKPVTIVNIGIGENEAKNGLKVYPNPVSGNAFIELPAGGNYNQVGLRCFDINGKEVKLSFTLVQDGIKLRTESMSSGSYFFEVYNAQSKIGNGKFVVK